jgi:hypothetical protein
MVVTVTMETGVTNGTEVTTEILVAEVTVEIMVKITMATKLNIATEKKATVLTELNITSLGSAICWNTERQHVFLCNASLELINAPRIPPPPTHPPEIIVSKTSTLF